MIMWSPGMKLEEIEKQIILKALRFYDYNKTKTAESLGIAIRTIDNKLEKYGVHASGGIHLESTPGSAEEFKMPLRKRPKVQEVSSK